MLVDLTESNWAEVVEGTHLPVLVVVSADWCLACQQYRPTLEKLAVAERGQLVIAVVDADRNRSLCRQHRVRALPTTMLFRQGREVARLVGVQDELELRQLVRVQQELPFTAYDPGE